MPSAESVSEEEEGASPGVLAPNSTSRTLPGQDAFDYGDSLDHIQIDPPPRRGDRNRDRDSGRKKGRRNRNRNRNQGGRKKDRDRQRGVAVEEPVEGELIGEEEGSERRGKKKQNSGERKTDVLINTLANIVCSNDYLYYFHIMYNRSASLYSLYSFCLAVIPPSKPEVSKLSDTSVLVKWSHPKEGLSVTFYKLQYKEMSEDRQKSRWRTIDEDIPDNLHMHEVTDLKAGMIHRNIKYRYNLMCFTCKMYMIY